MNDSLGIMNMQQIPGETDFDDRPRSEEDRVREKDKQTPFEKQTNKTVGETVPQKDQRTINEMPFAPPPQRSMSGMSVYERRIF